MSDDLDYYRKLGASIALIERDAEPEQYRRIHFKNAAQDKDFKSLGRLVSDIGYWVFEQCGREKTAAAIQLQKMSSLDRWLPVHTKMARNVMGAIGKIDAEFAGHEKKSSSPLPALAGGTFGLAFKNVPALAKLLLLSAVATGGAVGTVNWAANRDIKHDRGDMENMKSRIHYYNRLADEIESDLNHKINAGNESNRITV